MEDSNIIELYFARDEKAVEETQSKYSAYLRTIAFNILFSQEDALECENEAYSKVWNTVPPEKPQSLKSYIGRITRNLAIDRLKNRNAQKRGLCNADAAMEELCECIPDGKSDFSDDVAIKDALNSFLRSLKEEHRNIFIERYWYVYSINEIAEKSGLSESKVKSILFRTRKNLKVYLEKEGISI